MGAVRLGRVGAAAGLRAAIRSGGMALGTATAAAVTAVRLPIHLADDLTPAVAALASYQDGFLVAGIVALVAAVPSLVRCSPRAVTSGPRPAAQPAIGDAV